MIKNVEFKTPNNEVLQETNLATLYDDMSEKIVKESEDFEGSSSFIEVPKQIAETKAIINVINKKDSQCFMWSILAALYTSNPNKTSSYVPHLNKLNFDGISFPTPLNELSRGHYKDPVVYRGIDAPKIFIEKLEKDAIEIDNIYKKSKPLLPLTESEKQLYDNANNCYVCGQTFHENNIKISLKTFGKYACKLINLNPVGILPPQFYHGMLCFLHTKVAIELFTDYDMLLFIEKGVRGGISQCCNRYAIANNRYMSNFNPDDEIKYLMYLDANNLYGYAMSKYLPLKDFVWSDNDLTEQDILNLSDESDVAVEKKQFNSPPQLENQSQCRRKTTQLVSRNETTQLNRRKQLNSRNEQLNSAAGTKQLNSSVGTKQLNSVLPSTAYDRLQPPTTAYNHLQPPTTACNRLQPPTTACNRLHRLYSRIGFFYLLICSKLKIRERKNNIIIIVLLNFFSA
ncbi:DNA_pol_B_2 domain-containing protein [Trichonephila clavipes]|uniref:DNA_pol_B_2 domain-containing protein n=1 Tax=Trichonephila clavipes TaxID=2585209 RepID=A0A8X6VLJ0_TRICX|nr:DNA_pol_B_2 domain-containing protein [Trichonephila clavipes]